MKGSSWEFTLGLLQLLLIHTNVRTSWSLPSSSSVDGSKLLIALLSDLVSSGADPQATRTSPGRGRAHVQQAALHIIDEVVCSMDRRDEELDDACTYLIYMLEHGNPGEGHSLENIHGTELRPDMDVTTQRTTGLSAIQPEETSSSNMPINGSRKRKYQETRPRADDSGA
jgi:hypothetical protein